MKKLDGQERTLDHRFSPVMEGGRAIHRAMDRIDVLISHRLGLQRNELRCLYRLHDGPATPRALAVETGLTSGSVTALLDRLERLGMIERRRCPDDRRSVIVAVPSATLARLDAIVNELSQAITGHFEALPPAALAAMAAGITDFAAALESAATLMAESA